ncbi:DUF4224 domain-containing protein [Paraburkholderia acidiphila]|uniref:DUF4224 domain-containing protein n=2 Tax=Paraburkholderia acidiphila TaxID=2571747 RepID=A0A7Z2GDW1_9BURK|nr:DUF4224 domain-containing protein [Paraburkholderia acidiphila]
MRRVQRSSQEPRSMGIEHKVRADGRIIVSRGPTQPRASHYRASACRSTLAASFTGVASCTDAPSINQDT